MTRFIVHGIVPQFRGDEFALAAENAQQLRDFWKAERIDTVLEDYRGHPSVKLRGSLTRECKPGSRVAVTIETFDRADGRRVKAVSVDPVPIGPR